MGRVKLAITSQFAVFQFFKVPSDFRLRFQPLEDRLRRVLLGHEDGRAGPDVASCVASLSQVYKS
jgi:hypothetical protein